MRLALDHFFVTEWPTDILILNFSLLSFTPFSLHLARRVNIFLSWSLTASCEVSPSSVMRMPSATVHRCGRPSIAWSRWCWKYSGAGEMWNGSLSQLECQRLWGRSKLHPIPRAKTHSLRHRCWKPWPLTSLVIDHQWQEEDGGYASMLCWAASSQYTFSTCRSISWLPLDSTPNLLACWLVW